jgi:hypothetical protein
MTRAALLLVVSSVVATAAPPHAVSQPRLAPVTIPFELAGRHVIVGVRIDDSRPLAFVLDTGASVAMVRTETARALGLSLYGSVTSGGAGPARQAGQRVRGAAWSLVGFDRFSQPVTLALPMPEVSPALGRPIDGIIGGEFISAFVVALDYQARTVTLHDPTMFQYSGSGEVLPIEFTSSGHPRSTASPPSGSRSPQSTRCSRSRSLVC